MNLLHLEIALWLIISIWWAYESLYDFRDTKGDLAYAHERTLADKQRQHQIILAASMNRRSAMRELIGSVLSIVIGVGSLMTLLTSFQVALQAFTIIFPLALFTVLIWNTIVKRLNRRDRHFIIVSAVDRAVEAQKQSKQEHRS